MYSRSGGMVKGVPNAYEMNYHLAVAANTSTVPPPTHGQPAESTE